MLLIMQEKNIYTLGTGRRSMEDFIEILLSYGIEAFLDVRSFPRSKDPIFQRDSLQEVLSLHGIQYLFLGKELGGLRKGGYAAYIVTEDFQKGIEAVETIAAKKISVIACSEKLPWKCHRKWIARELHKRGWTVKHIIDKGKTWVPK
jgi:uncharacterized protein (DUF488 family)